MGVVKALKAFAEIPAQKRTIATKETIEKGAEFLLQHHIYKQSHNLNKTSKPGWKRFGFPLMYQTDALEILDILTGLGIRDARMDDAFELMMSKQDNEGKWTMENTYDLLVPVEPKGTQSKWLTLRAMRIMKRYNIQ